MYRSLALTKIMLRLKCLTVFCPFGVHSPPKPLTIRTCFVQFYRLYLPIIFLSGGLLWADTAAFDLAGPKIEVRVTRAGKTLPISRVPNLKQATDSGFIPKCQMESRYGFS